MTIAYRARDLRSGYIRLTARQQIGWLLQHRAKRVAGGLHPNDPNLPEVIIVWLK